MILKNQEYLTIERVKYDKQLLSNSRMLFSHASWRYLKQYNNSFY